MMVRNLLITSMIFSLAAGTTQAVENSAPSNVDADANRRVVPKNVELDADNNLNFAFVDSIGRSHSNATAIVVVNRQPGKYQANANGRFVVPVQRSGIIVVIDGDYTYGCRVWKHGTAPPRSLTNIAFIKKDDAVAEVRGQAVGAAFRATEKLYGLAILGLGGIAVWQALDDDAS